MIMYPSMFLGPGIFGRSAESGWHLGTNYFNEAPRDPEITAQLELYEHSRLQICGCCEHVDPDAEWNNALGGQARENPRFGLILHGPRVRKHILSR